MLLRWVGSGIWKKGSIRSANYGWQKADGTNQRGERARLTNECNLKCPHCSQSTGLVKISRLTKQQIVKALVLAGDLGAKEITLSGGEPLLYKDLFFAVNRARAGKIREIESLQDSLRQYKNAQDKLQNLNEKMESARFSSLPSPISESEKRASWVQFNLFNDVPIFSSVFPASLSCFIKLSASAYWVAIFVFISINLNSPRSRWGFTHI